MHRWVDQAIAKGQQLGQTEYLLWLITLGHGFTHWCPVTFYLLFPFLVRELDLAYSHARFLITIRAAANPAVNVPAGMLVDLIGKRGLLIAPAPASTASPYLLIGLSHTCFWLVFFMAFVEVGNYLWHSAAMSNLSEKYPPKRGLAIAMHAIGPNLGESIAPLKEPVEV